MDTIFSAYIDGKDMELDLEPGDEIDVQISNDTGSNGYPQHTAPLKWVNAVGVNLSPASERIQFSISIGDPRGAFVFEVSRLDDGTIVLDTPDPSDSFPHLPTKRLSPSRLVVTTDKGEPRFFDLACEYDSEDCHEGCHDCDDDDYDDDDLTMASEDEP